MTGYIYKIINKKNGHFYIGSTINIKKRESQHFSNLRRKTHHCEHLQYAFNKYGEDSFVLIYKEYHSIEESDLRNIEERYISFCWNSGKLYNSSKKASGGDNITTLSEERRNEIKKL